MQGGTSSRGQRSWAQHLGGIVHVNDPYSHKSRRLVELVFRSHDETGVLGSAPWAPTAADQAAAWVFYNELLSRVTVARLGYREGDEAAALTSVYLLFGRARDLIERHGAAAEHFAVLVSAALTRIRPFTSRWHRLNLAGGLERQDQRRIFRKALQGLQADLALFAAAFGDMAKPDSPLQTNRVAMIDPNPLHLFDDRAVSPAMLGPAAPSSNDGTAVNGSAVLAKEMEWVAAKRGDKGGALGSSGDEAASPMGVTGLALSGGGVRSATFAVGVLQAFARAGILEHFDYQATVSGGGYTGAFLTSHHHEGNESPLDDHAGHAEGAALRWIRNRTKFLQWGGVAGVLEWILRAMWRLALLLSLLVGVALVAQLLRLIQLPMIVIGIAAIVVCVSWIFGPNVASFHRLYRNRLARTFTNPTHDKQPKVQKLSNLEPTMPYPLVCTTLNVPRSKNAELRGRRSDFFTLAPRHCGGSLVGYAATKDYEKANRRLDLATAMAVSGAAASSNLGRMITSKAARFIARPIGFVVGLGLWVTHPTKAKQTSAGGIKARAFAPLYWFAELTGSMTDRLGMLNLSDGGHIDNLGVYELLRRRCKFIVCIDGERDPGLRCVGLIKACRYAAIDLGADVRIDLSELHLGPDGLSQAHFALGTIRYEPIDSTDDTEEPGLGYLLYIKSSMSGDELDYVAEYRERHTDFPHQSTTDQFFDEDQYEAYRALGEHVGNDLFAPELVGTRWWAEPLPMRGWLQELVEAVEPKTARPHIWETPITDEPATNVAVSGPY